MTTNTLKTKTTKITSLLLALIMLLSTFGGLTITAQAKTFLVDAFSGEFYWSSDSKTHTIQLNWPRNYCEVYAIEYESDNHALELSVDSPTVNGETEFHSKNGVVYHNTGTAEGSFMVTVSPYCPTPNDALGFDQCNYSVRIYNVTPHPKKTKIKEIKRGKKSFKTNWKSVKNVTGYQIQYSTNKKFKNAKKVAVKGTSKSNATVKNLKKNKKYYVRIRTYKSFKGWKFYSDWSKVKTVKTK